MRVSKKAFRMQVIGDDSPDDSYLQQVGFEDRRAAYERGEFGFIGIRAYAWVEVGGSRQRLVSPGVWGVESDYDQAYMKELFEEECYALEGILEELGILVDSGEESEEPDELLRTS